MKEKINELTRTKRLYSRLIKKKAAKKIPPRCSQIEDYQKIRNELLKKIAKIKTKILMQQKLKKSSNAVSIFNEPPQKKRKLNDTNYVELNEKLNEKKKKRKRKKRNKNNEEYEVQQIIKDRNENGVEQYLVEWTEGSISWEPKKNLVNCQILLKEYHDYNVYNNNNIEDEQKKHLKNDNNNNNNNKSKKRPWFDMIEKITFGEPVLKKMKFQ